MNFIVEAVKQSTSFQDVTPVASWLDKVLHGAQGPVPGGGGYINSVLRRAPWELLETTKDGVTYSRLGGEYDVVLVPD
jgi:hypothetical protein